MRRRPTVPVAVTSTISGPGDREMLPPITATRCDPGERKHSVEHAVDDGHVERVGQHQRQKRGAGPRAHRRQVAQIDRERAVPDGVRRHEPMVEVHAFDLYIGREHFERSALGLDDSGIVARSDNDPVRRRQPRRDASNEGALAEVGNGASRTTQKGEFSPALPCGEVE